jgi:hypothetical protein
VTQLAEDAPSAEPAGRRRIAHAAPLVVSVLAIATFLSALTVTRASDDIYGIPGWGVAATVVLLCLTVVGCGLIASSRQPVFSVVVLAAAALGVAGILAIFSFGVLAVLLAGGLLAWAGSGRWSSARTSSAVVGGLLTGAPLPVLVSFALAGPLVECHTDGVTTGGNVFLGAQSTRETSTSPASATGEPDGTFSGHVEGDGYDYSYVCRDGRLVEFDLRWR